MGQIVGPLDEPAAMVPGKGRQANNTQIGAGLADRGSWPDGMVVHT